MLTDSTSPITAETLRNAIYTKAVIKETFRLNPISVGIGRILQTDVVLSGYRVPKGVVYFFYFINKLFIFKGNDIRDDIGSLRENLIGMFQTVVVTQNQVICRLTEYFDEPNSFRPERWLRDNNDTVNKLKGKSINPYTVLPFGHGPRSCIARRFAEQNLQVVLLRVRVLKIMFTYS